MKAFVTDGSQRPALAITRSLGRRGISVLVGDERPASLASSSKYCSGHVTYPSPYRTPDAFDRFLSELVARERVDVVIPVTDVTTHAVATGRESLTRDSALAAPSLAAFDFISDKWNVVERAARYGIPTPRTYFVDGVAGLRAVLDRVEYPAVVKPVRSRIRAADGWASTSVQYAWSASDLSRLYRETDYLSSYPSLIQERIVGPGVGVFVLCRHGQVVCAFAHRRLREKPPSGGVSVLCESAALDPELRDQAMRLLGPLGWHGVAMIEYKQDRRTGRFYLMEVNGRFWGSLQLAIDAGVDFPYLSFQLAAGGPVEPPATYKVGVRSRWLLGDLDHLWLRLSRSDRDLPPGTPSKPAALLEFLKFVAPGLRYDVISRDDPQPMLYELQQYAKLSAGSVVRRARRKATRLSAAPSADPAPMGGRNAGAVR
jgi:predicted ATP-grasp superfamily ATP-dependent carboligase